MNNAKLAAALREHAEKIRDTNPENFTADFINDTAELVRVLARVVEGKPLDRAFGAPGDWGYGTPIGDALAGRSCETVPYPDFCRHPEKCKGKSHCPRELACND